MALQDYNWEDQYGEIHPTMYLKIEIYGVVINSGECYFTLGWFANKAAADSGKPSMKQYSNSWVVADKNGDLREQAYFYIRGLPEFSNLTSI